MTTPSVRRQINRAFQEHFPPGRGREHDKLKFKVIDICSRLLDAAYQAGRDKGRDEITTDIAAGIKFSQWLRLTWRMVKAKVYR